MGMIILWLEVTKTTGEFETSLTGGLKLNLKGLVYV